MWVLDFLCKPMSYRILTDYVCICVWFGSDSSSCIHHPHILPIGPTHFWVGCPALRYGAFVELVAALSCWVKRHYYYVPWVVWSPLGSKPDQRARFLWLSYQAELIKGIVHSTRNYNHSTIVNTINPSPLDLINRLVSHTVMVIVTRVKSSAAQLHHIFVNKVYVGLWRFEFTFKLLRVL